MRPRLPAKQPEFLEPGRATAVTSIPSVHLVILNWNGLDDTLECLASLHEQDYPSLRIHVVDNGSAESEATEIERLYPRVNVMRQTTNLGFCGGNNVGIRQALEEGADYVLILNNDSVAPPNMISTLINESASLDNVGAVSPVILHHPDHQTVWYAGSVWESEIAGFRHVLEESPIEQLQQQQPYTTAYACGCCLLVHSSVLRSVGLMDERYFAYFDEADWCSRMKKAGFECYVVPRARLYHKVSASAPKLIATYLMARNRLLWMKEHLPGIERRRSITYLLKETIWNILNIGGWSGGKYQHAPAHSRAMLWGWRDYLRGRFGKWPEQIQRLNMAKEAKEKAAKPAV